MQSWVAIETAAADFGDERLDARYRALLGRMGDKPSLSIPAACKGYAETQAAYRFFANAKTTPDKVLEPHRQATLQRVRAEPVVIAARDTTEVDLTRKNEKVGGPLSDEQHWGLYVHPLLLMTPGRLPLGVVHAEMWSRDPAEFAKSSEQRRTERRQKPFEDKESYRWLTGYRTARQVAAEAPGTQVVCVSDSDGDIYECILAGAAEDGPRADWIVRGCQDRSLVGEGRNLLQLLSRAAPLGTLAVQVSPREASTGNGRRRRQARGGRRAGVTVRAVRTCLSPPHRPGRKLPPVPVNAVLVREESPPAGEEPVEWLLLTNLPTETFAACCAVIDYYCCRWEIEVYFRVLKSGCKVEELQFEHVERVQVCLALYLIVAWRVLHLLMLGRQCPGLSCETALSEAEWKSVYVITTGRPPPPTPPTLEEMIQRIAELGGYLRRKGDGPPGPKTTWIGIQRMRDFAIAWGAFGPQHDKSCVQR